MLVWTIWRRVWLVKCAKGRGANTWPGGGARDAGAGGAGHWLAMKGGGTGTGGRGACGRPTSAVDQVPTQRSAAWAGLISLAQRLSAIATIVRAYRLCCVTSQCFMVLPSRSNCRCSQTWHGPSRIGACAVRDDNRFRSQPKHVQHGRLPLVAQFWCVDQAAARGRTRTGGEHDVLLAAGLEGHRRGGEAGAEVHLPQQLQRGVVIGRN